MNQRKEKNTMRTPEEKEIIVKEYLETNLSLREVMRKYDISSSTMHKWVTNYRNYGLAGLISQTGKKKGVSKGRPRKLITHEEELELENIKLRIENERLKKGYLVKGVGAKKEYVTIKNSNTK